MQITCCGVVEEQGCTVPMFLLYLNIRQLLCVFWTTYARIWFSFFEDVSVGIFSKTSQKNLVSAYTFCTLIRIQSYVCLYLPSKQQRVLIRDNNKYNAGYI